MSVIAYIGGAPYPVYETFILFTLIFFATSIYIGLRFDGATVETRDDDTSEEVADV